MEFRLVLAFLLFCAAAVYTVTDVGVDLLLVNEYHERLSEEIANNRSYANNNHSCVVDPNIGWLQGIWTYDQQILLLLFKRLTILWIASGGVLQTVIVIFLAFRHDPNLCALPKSVRVMTLISAPFLMGPVVVNVYAATYVFCNAEKNCLRAKIDR